MSLNICFNSFVEEKYRDKSGDAMRIQIEHERINAYWRRKQEEEDKLWEGWDPNDPSTEPIII